MTADNFPPWVFFGAKVAELRHRQSGPDLALIGKMTADNFPHWVFFGAKVAELRHRQSGPDLALIGGQNFLFLVCGQSY